MSENEPNSTAPAPQLQPQPEPDLMRLPPRGEEPFWNYEDLVVFAVLMLPSLAVGWFVLHLLAGVAPLGPPTGAVRLLGSQFLGYGVWFLCLWMLLKIRYGRPFWSSLGWTIPDRGIGTAMLAGPVLALGLAALAVLLDTPHVESPIEKLIADRRSLIIVGVIASTVGPLAEELAFRGFMMPLLVRSFGARWGVIATALPFALIHGPQYDFQWQNLLVLTLAACAFGWARLTFRSVIPAIIMHGLYNLTLFAGYSMQKDLAFRW